MEAARRIAKGLPSSFSIDNFLDENRENKFIEAAGKLAIVKTIWKEEADSKMFVAPNNIHNELNLADLRGTWYTKLSSLIFEGCTKKTLGDRLSRLTLIIFNYDRCVEHFLFWAIRLTYGMTNGEAADVMKRLTIYHPYGSVGGLPYLTTSNEVYFGNAEERNDPWEITKGLKTFTEGVESQQTTAIRQAVLEANMVIFLGFAFHSLNMALLYDPKKPPSYRGSTKHYYGTVLGRGKPDIQLLEARVKAMCKMADVIGQPRDRKPMANLVPVKCHQLFDEYHASFALERYPDMDV